MKIIYINSKKHGIKECLVDDEDYEFLNQWKWKLLVNYNSMYAVRNITICLGGGRKNKKYKSICLLMHREIMKLSDRLMLTDHRDQNGLNNQKHNLRVCTKAENNRNIGSHKDSKYSKFKGVSFDKSRNKWVAGITYQSKHINLGRFESEDEAAIAYNLKAVELFKYFACINKSSGL